MRATLSSRPALLYVTVASGVVGLFETSGWPSILVTAAGLWLVLGAPTVFWYGQSRRLLTGRDAAVLLSVGFALVTDFIVMLAVNYLPQMFGNRHPLTQVPIAAGFLFGDLLIGALVPTPPPSPTPWQSRRLPAGMPVIGGLGLLCVVLSIAGPTRLNNGYGPGAAIAAYVAVAALFVLLLVKRDSYPDATLQTGILCAAIACLFLTSLRGWMITGHDIQTEYDYFRLNYGGERWEIALYPGAYNACLSITLLPLALVHLTAISGVGVFKVVLPLLFALSPVALYRAARNATPPLIALLAAMFFIAFPAFLTDMPYLGRQEIAFVLLGAALVVATDPGKYVRSRRIVFAVLLGGIVLAHYSTSYVLILVLGAATGCEVLWRIGGRLTGKPRRRANKQQAFIRAWMAPAAIGLALLWAGPVTHTAGQLSTTLSAAVQELGGGGNKVGSSATSSSLFSSTPQISDAQRLADYRAQTIAATATARAQQVFLPLSVVDKYQTPVIPLADMPLTGTGKALQSAGIPVVSANGALRGAIAEGLQVLIVVGLLVVPFSRRRAFKATRDQYVLAFGALTMLGLLTVVPQFSVDYGLLRAFEQGIFFFGPFMAAGLVWLLSWTRRAAMPLLFAFMAGILLDLSGVIPQVTGGYPAQLALNDSGQYHDLYDPTQAEYVAATWIEQQVMQSGTTEKTRTPVEAELFTYNEIQTVYTGPLIADVFPTVISPSDYVFLGPEAVTQGQATLSYRGGLVAYKYPFGLLDEHKNLIYSANGVEIYR
jgi:uncharacterized membrane protein